MVEAVKRLVEERVLVHEQAEDPSLFRDRHMFCIEVWWQRNAGRGVWVWCAGLLTACACADWCHWSQVDMLIKSKLAALSHVFEYWARDVRTLPGGFQANSYMTVEEYLDMLEAASFFDKDLTVREVKIAYVIGQGTTVDEQASTHHRELGFCEFLEAVCGGGGAWGWDVRHSNVSSLTVW